MKPFTTLWSALLGLSLLGIEADARGQARSQTLAETKSNEALEKSRPAFKQGDYLATSKAIDEAIASSETLPKNRCRSRAVKTPRRPLRSGVLQPGVLPMAAAEFPSNAPLSRSALSRSSSHLSTG